jgi:hypothetical protein
MATDPITTILADNSYKMLGLDLRENHHPGPNTGYYRAASQRANEDTRTYLWNFWYIRRIRWHKLSCFRSYLGTAVAIRYLYFYKMGQALLTPTQTAEHLVPST